MKKYVEVDREPKVGDMVKVVKTTVVPKTDGVDDYKVGDMLKIVDENFSDYEYSINILADGGIHRALNRSEFVVVEEVNEFTKSDIKGGYLVKLRIDEVGLVIMANKEFNIIGDEGDIIGVSQDYGRELKWLDDEDELDIVEVYGYTTDQSDLFNPSTRELLFKREEVEDLGKKEYVIESTVNDNEITIAYNHPNGYDDSDDSIHILIGDDLSDDYAFTTISIKSAKDMISALQEIVDYVEGGK